MLFRSIYQTATMYPTKNALIIGNTCITYYQLLLYVEHIIALLRSLDVKELDCVALVLPNSPEFVASFYALCHLHAVSLLIDPNVKPDELKFFFLDNEVKFVITETYHSHLCKEVIDATDLNIHCIELEDLTKQESVNMLAGRVLSLPSIYDGPVIYQYSSGSTGRSKRICRTQKNLVCEGETVIAALRMTAGDNVLGLLPLCHSFGLNTCLLGLIATGATLVLFEQTSVDNSKRNVPLILQTSRILELIERERITILPSAPYLYSALAETPEEIQYDLSSLRLCLAGGNFIPKETFQRFKKRFSIPIRSVYGSTELGYIAVNMERDADVQYDCSGIPPTGVEVKILDNTMRESLPNSIGEIAVKSGALASGYLNRLELNAKVFRDGFFLVGDVGKKDEQGRLSVVGRKRIFIDAGGEKVDPQEIEQVLSAHPAIKEVAVIGVPGPYGGEAIKAVVVPKASLTEEEVWSFCKERLTEYKVPRFVVFCNALPRSPLGKLLRKYLVEEPVDPDRENASSSRGDPLRQALFAFHHDLASAQRLLTAWICQQEADLLRINVSQVNAQRPFSEMGLGSLLSVELRNNLEAALELTLPISILWSYSTPEDLSSHLTSLLFTQAKLVSANTSSSFQKGEGTLPSFSTLVQFTTTERQQQLESSMQTILQDAQVHLTPGSQVRESTHETELASYLDQLNQMTDREIQVLLKQEIVKQSEEDSNE